MVDPNIIAEKLKHLSLRTAKVRAFCPYDLEDLTVESDLLDLISFNLFLAVQTCLDLATHLISDEGWRPAATAGEALERLGEHGVVSQETCSLFAGPSAFATSLRTGTAVSTPPASLQPQGPACPTWSALPRR